MLTRRWRIAAAVLSLVVLLTFTILLVSRHEASNAPSWSDFGYDTPEQRRGSSQRKADRPSPSQLQQINSGLQEDIEALQHLNQRTQEQMTQLKVLLEEQQEYLELVAPEGGFPSDESAHLFDPTSHDLTILKRLNAQFPHKLREVYYRLQYWSPNSRHKLPNPGHQYLTFEPDAAGLNNIRMSFEVLIVFAWMTRRTLVLPPVLPVYLLDFGNIARDAPGQSSGRTSLGEFFDLESIAAAVPLITTDQFIAQSSERFSIPQEFRTPDWASSVKKIESWFSWLASHEAVGLLPWGPIPNMVAFPDKETVLKANLKGFSIIRSGRKVREYTREMKETPVLHGIASRDYASKDYLTYRYLGQVSSAVVWADGDLDISMKQMLKDHVHYVPLVFEVAARVIAYLGIFKYSSYHIRRNDNQYKDTFIPAEKSLENTQELLLPGEALYLATDEMAPGFFQAFHEDHPVFRWDDFFTEVGGEVLKDVTIPRKLIGPIEQVICSGGRMFFGTGTSTFSSYIHRLRGYIEAPVLDQLHHHGVKYSADTFRPNQPQPVAPGARYMEEDPKMWLLPLENQPRRLVIGQN